MEVAPFAVGAGTTTRTGISRGVIRRMIPWKPAHIEDSLDSALAIITLGRLLFVPFIIATTMSSSLATAGLLAVFIGVDVADGVIGRHRESDGPWRRAIDSMVDRLSVSCVYVGAAAFGLLPVWLLALLLVRDAYCSELCMRMMRARWVTIRPDLRYKVLNVSLACWIVVAPNVSSTVGHALFGGILVWSIWVAVDLRRCVRAVLDAPVQLDGVVVKARDLR